MTSELDFPDFVCQMTCGESCGDKETGGGGPKNS